MASVPDKPLVSVIVPTYNRAHFLGDAIESILAQTYPNIEIVVVDDGSTDKTAEVISRFRGRVRYYRQGNRGQVTARNFGMKQATGDFIAPLDSDDIWLPEKTAKQVDMFRADPELDVIFGLGDDMDAGGKVLRVAAVVPKGWEMDSLELPFAAYACRGDVLTALIQRNAIWHSTVMMRRKAILEAGGYDPQCMSCSDWDLWLRLALNGCKFGFLGNIVYRWRRHDSQLTQDLTRHTEGRIGVLKKILACETCPVEARRTAERRIAGELKIRGDYMIVQGNCRKAREYYRQAMGYWPRPTQHLSWLLTWLGPVGRQGVRLLNWGSDMFG